MATEGAEAAVPEAPGWELGCKVVLTTAVDKEVTGEVFAYDANTDTVVLVSDGAQPTQTNLMLLQGEHIKEVKSCEPPKQPVDQELPIIDRERSKARMAKALEAAEDMSEKMGVGVTREAQKIFEALDKTMPCVWRGKTIVVLDEVMVAEPYTASATTAKDPSSKVLQRVRMVLEMERAKLANAS